MARVIVAGSKPTLWFDYDTPLNRQWGASELTARYGDVARHPKSGDAGITLKLPAQRKSPGAIGRGPLAMAKAASVVTYVSQERATAIAAEELLSGVESRELWGRSGPATATCANRPPDC